MVLFKIITLKQQFSTLTWKTLIAMAALTFNGSISSAAQIIVHFASLPKEGYPEPLQAQLKDKKPYFSSAAGFVVYNGGTRYISDKNGLVTIPKLQPDETINVIITPEVEPDVLAASTIVGLKVAKGCSAQVYTCQRVAENNKKYRWQINASTIQEGDSCKMLEGTVLILSDPNKLELETNPPLMEQEQYILPTFFVLDQRVLNSLSNNDAMAKEGTTHIDSPTISSQDEATINCLNNESMFKRCDIKEQKTSDNFVKVALGQEETSKTPAASTNNPAPSKSSNPAPTIKP